MNKALSLLLLSSLAVPALALEPMPEAAGWSGFANVGAGDGNVESNFLARISGVDIDLGGGNVLRPRAAYINRDLDGDAMSQEGGEVGITYTKTTASYRWVNDLSYTSLAYGEEDSDNDTTVWMVNISMFRRF